MIVATVDSTLGAGLIGMVLSAVMYGVTTVQVHTYFHGSEGDSMLLKLAISLLWILDSTHQILITHAIYWYAVTEFGNAEALASPVWRASMPVFAIMQFIIRIIFCVRIWNISSKMDRLAHWRKYIVTVAILASSFGEFGIVMVVAAREAMFGYLDGSSEEATPLYFGLSLCAAGDILIAYAQIIVLRQWRSGFRSTDSILRTLMLYSINSALLTSVCALGNLITFAALPGTLIFQAFYFILPKLLLNSCLATLNARRDLRQVMNSMGSLEPIPVPHFPSLRSPSLRFRPSHDEGVSYDVIDIRIDKSTSIKLDPPPRILHDCVQTSSIDGALEKEVDRNRVGKLVYRRVDG
ncbi:hypothetical protein OBBRIDRAFT_353211 [Obba rivulosa]|uniref:DUF6534 domain-containing protein n=1 Tax=Obba rivulosa TaxID=1052685 RepID=A0A8E2J4L0_9APHY|nr:hypothetical protein OBBRIDRAFT_353211 [Obba rivulosa]